MKAIFILLFIGGIVWAGYALCNVGTQIVQEQVGRQAAQYEAATR